MIIVKVFNNNAVAVITEDKREAVVLGSGIGFQKKINDEVNKQRVEKIYYVQDTLQTKFLDLLKNTKEEYFRIAYKIVQHAQLEGINMNIQAVIPLTEHISFAIKRKQDGIDLPNLLLDEIRTFYHKEFIIGKWAIEFIKEQLNIELDDNEAGYIALHIINAFSNESTNNTINTIQFVKGIIDCINKCYNLEVTDKTFEGSRLIVHLKYLAQRIFKNKDKSASGLSEMLDVIIKQNQLHKTFAVEIYNYLLENFNYKISKEEVVYILIHISRYLSTI